MHHNKLPYPPAEMSEAKLFHDNPLFKVKHPHAVISDVEDVDEEISPKSLDRFSDFNGWDRCNNRMIVCVFAISLLWLTSLQICVSIVNTQLSIPIISSVFDSCNYARRRAVEQKSHYDMCVEHQVRMCGTDLDAALLQERSRVESVRRSNLKKIQILTIATENNTNSLNLFKETVEAWRAQGSAYSIPYRSNCSTRSDVEAMLGDTSSSDGTDRPDTTSLSQQYAFDSDGRVASLVDYTSALSSYNIKYLHNKTKALQVLSMNVALDVTIPRIGAISSNLEAISPTFERVLACATFSDSPELNCRLGHSALSLYNQIRLVLNHQIDELAVTFHRIHAEVDSYSELLLAAIAAADQFFDSVRGAQGIGNWIISNTGITGLCGKSSPSFCDFSKVKRSGSFIHYFSAAVRNLYPLILHYNV